MSVMKNETSKYKYIETYYMTDASIVHPFYSFHIHIQDELVNYIHESSKYSNLVPSMDSSQV